MPTGGKIPPDGRPPVAPGVGKTARRHDLEAPATPGLSDSDLQQGDVQALEAAQKVAPRAKRNQPPATGNAPARRRQGAQRGSEQFALPVPDPVDLAAKRAGDTARGQVGGGRTVDPSTWLPLAEQLALAPNAGGAIVSQLANQLTQFRRRPIVSQANFIDLDEMDRTIGSL